MDRLRLFFLIIILSNAILLSVQAKTDHFALDKREQLPTALNNFYMGVGEGNVNSPFSNSNLSNGIQAGSFTTESYAPMVFIGRYFNPYLAVEISMLGRYDVYANDIAGKHRIIHMSLFSASLRPTLPVTQHMSLYGLLGIGTISRSGFSVNNVTAISTTNLATFLTGGGAAFAVTSHFRVAAGLEYAPARNSVNQTSTTYVYAGIYYLLHYLHLSKNYATQYIFHKHLIQVGGFSRSIFNPHDINNYFAPPDSYVPIFWSGSVAVRNGAWVRYEKNVFHTHKIFSLDWGVSVSTYDSKMNNSSFQAFSIFPLVRLWFIRSRLVDFYFSYSAVGPSYMTKRYIDNRDLGGNFIFQDLIGLGGFLGKNKQVDFEAGIGHYSNGNFFPRNPGIDVPLTLSLGYAFL